MAQTKKHHYVPRFLLRNFSRGTKKNPKVWVLDKSTGEIRYDSVRDVAHQNKFYEYKDDKGTKFDLENLTQKIDSMGAEVVRKILEEKSLSLCVEDKEVLSYFITCQMVRTDGVRKDMRNFREMVVHKWGPDILPESGDRPIGDFGSEDDKLASLMFMAEGVPEFAKILQEKVWFFGEAPINTSFFISDNPVAKHNMIDRGPRGNLGLRNDGIEIYMPLSTRFTIHVICPKIAALAYESPQIGQQCTNSAESGLPLVVSPGNVEFANSFQVLSAERFVFARDRGDLDLAIDMLRTNPELKDGRGDRQCPEDA